jgi:2-(1,2-epoxy-1,2-dihydrophenyl)acetyl-CoA isomerase
VSHAVVVTGAGRGFCVGQDLAEFRGHQGDLGERLRSTYHRNVLAIRALEKPVIAAVNGPAAGAGLSLACACDMRIAAESASFVPAFIGIGLVPDSGGSYFISRLLGPARAFEWMSQNLSSPRGLGGAVSAVVADHDLMADHGHRRRRVRAGADTRRRSDKRLYDRAATAALDEQPGSRLSSSRLTRPRTSARA